MDEMQKELSQQERQKLELTQFCIDNAADAIFWLDAEGSFIYANEAALQHLGYTLEELLSMKVHRVDPNYPQEDWPNHWSRVKRNKKMSFESVHITKSGEEIPVDIKVSHLELREMEFHCAFVRNISKRRIAEQNLLESESRLRKTLDVTSDGFWDRNLTTGEVYYGAKWTSVLGYSEKDLLSGKISWESLLHPEDRERSMQALRDHLDGINDYYDVEFRLRNSDEKWQWIRARGQVIEFDEDGMPMRFVGTHTDITSRKELERTLLKSSEETKLFAYSVAHDLRNPAIAIRGLAERLHKKHEELTDEQKLKYCDRIIDTSEQLVDLVEKINSYICSKETSLAFEEVPLKEIVQLSRREFAARLQYRNIEWLEFQENPIARVDRLSMIRVLRNLIENSLKYGGPQLSKISIEYLNTSGFHVLSVRDNGVGMTVEDSKRIFQPFERKDTTAQQAGSGLGLAIVKEIAHQHKGDVWVEPNRKRGVKFCFAFSKNI